jgi:cytochrome c oxidase subunit 4
MVHTSHAAHGSEAHGAHGHFVPPVMAYAGTLGALLVLTVITVWVAQFDLGPMNTVVAVAVATLKASLVAAFFMGLRWDEPLNAVAFLFGLLTLAIFFILTLCDLRTRDWIEELKGNRVIEAEIQYKAQTEAAKSGTPAAPAAPAAH